MTDKKIIDGIDVSECMWFVRAEGRYVKDYCHCYREFDFCKEKTDCYYKQLQRKNAECEELKKEYEDILDSRQREWEEEYERYEQALDDIEVFCRTNDFYVDSTAWEIFKIIKEAKEGEL